MPTWPILLSLFPAAFKHPAFILIWTANTVALVGIAMFDAGAGWLMSRLDADPLIVSLVQTAAMLPMFLLTLPAGAIADVVNSRRLLIANSIFIAALIASFATIVAAKLATPASLLATIFVLSGAWALNAPAWLSIIPSLTPRADLEFAVAANGIGYYVSRAVGPALAGFVITHYGMPALFWLFSGANVAAVLALLAWRQPPPQSGNRLPPERIGGAVYVGLRHALHNRHLRSTLVRALAIYPFASAYWALLPLIARHALGKSEFYGAMLAVIALGAISGSLTLAFLKRKLGPDRVVALGTVGTSAALVFFGGSHRQDVLLATCFVAGLGWIVVLTTLYVSAQEALPAWVRARGLAVLLTVVFGSVSAGSAVWGQIASAAGLSTALFVAATGAMIAIPLTWRWKLQTAGGRDLSPALHWRRLNLTRTLDHAEGPVLVTLDYSVAPGQRAAFLEAIEEIGHERKRDGADTWGFYEDVEQEGRFLEIFTVGSWLELRRLRERVTGADREIEERVSAMLTRPRRHRVHIAPPRPDVRA